MNEQRVRYCLQEALNKADPDLLSSPDYDFNAFVQYTLENGEEAAQKIFIERYDTLIDFSLQPQADVDFKRGSQIVFSAGYNEKERTIKLALAAFCEKHDPNISEKVFRKLVKFALDNGVDTLNKKFLFKHYGEGIEISFGNGETKNESPIQKKSSQVIEIPEEIRHRNNYYLDTTRLKHNLGSYFRENGLSYKDTEEELNNWVEWANTEVGMEMLNKRFLGHFGLTLNQFLINKRVPIHINFEQKPSEPTFEDTDSHAFDFPDEESIAETVLTTVFSESLPEGAIQDELHQFNGLPSSVQTTGPPSYVGHLAEIEFEEMTDDEVIEELEKFYLEVDTKKLQEMDSVLYAARRFGRAKLNKYLFKIYGKCLDSNPKPQIQEAASTKKAKPPGMGYTRDHRETPGARRQSKVIIDGKTLRGIGPGPSSLIGSVTGSIGLTTKQSEADMINKTSLREKEIKKEVGKSVDISFVGMHEDQGIGTLVRTNQRIKRTLRSAPPPNLVPGIERQEEAPAVSPIFVRQVTAETEDKEKADEAQFKSKEIYETADYETDLGDEAAGSETDLEKAEAEISRESMESESVLIRQRSRTIQREIKSIKVENELSSEFDSKVKSSDSEEGNEENKDDPITVLKDMQQQTKESLEESELPKEEISSIIQEKPKQKIGFKGKISNLAKGVVNVVQRRRSVNEDAHPEVVVTKGDLKEPKKKASKARRRSVLQRRASDAVVAEVTTKIGKGKIRLVTPEYVKKAETFRKSKKRPDTKNESILNVSVKACGNYRFDLYSPTGSCVCGFSKYEHQDTQQGNIFGVNRRFRSLRKPSQGGDIRFNVSINDMTLLQEYDQLFFTDGYSIKALKLNATVLKTKFIGGKRTLIPGKILIKLFVDAEINETSQVEYIMVQHLSSKSGLEQQEYKCIPFRVGYLSVECFINFMEILTELSEASHLNITFNEEQYERGALWFSENLSPEDINFKAASKTGVRKVEGVEVISKGRVVSKLTVIKLESRMFLVWYDKHEEKLLYSNLLLPKDFAGLVTAEVKVHELVVLQSLKTITWLKGSNKLLLSANSKNGVSLEMYEAEYTLDRGLELVPCSCEFCSNEDILDFIRSAGVLDIAFTKRFIYILTPGNGIMRVGNTGTRSRNIQIYFSEDRVQDVAFCVLNDWTLYIVDQASKSLYRLNVYGHQLEKLPFSLVTPSKLICLNQNHEEQSLLVAERLGKIRKISFKTRRDKTGNDVTVFDIVSNSNLQVLYSKLETTNNFWYSSFYTA
eukprot:augustus_masked-scaffold_1-processed-gene-29.65-mRNA-1 protein AED:1.00 eAED:1.00 QI:0/0/0/0/1/1/2/0/1262